jgi:predicted DNA-binding transcriptional regulator AlpA
MPADDLLFTKQVAKEYGLNYGTLRYWRCNDEGPASFTLGPRGRVVYRRSEVERWLAEMEQTTRRGGDSVQTTDGDTVPQPANGTPKKRRIADRVTA